MSVIVHYNGFPQCGVASPSFESSAMVRLTRKERQDKINLLASINKVNSDEVDATDNGKYVISYMPPSNVGGGNLKVSITFISGKI